MKLLSHKDSLTTRCFSQKRQSLRNSLDEDTDIKSYRNKSLLVRNSTQHEILTIISKFIYIPSRTLLGCRLPFVNNIKIMHMYIEFSLCTMQWPTKIMD